MPSQLVVDGLGDLAADDVVRPEREEHAACGKRLRVHDDGHGEFRLRRQMRDAGVDAPEGQCARVLVLSERECGRQHAEGDRPGRDKRLSHLRTPLQFAAGAALDHLCRP